MQSPAVSRLFRLRSLVAVFGLLAAVVGAEAQTAVARPISSKRDTRATAQLSPSSGLDARSALIAAKTIAAHIDGAQVLTVLPTGSMRPTFDEKAFLVVEPTAFENLAVGDIITFRHPKVGSPIVHRIFEKRGDSFWTKGDHNSRPDDEYVTRGNYHMRVVAVIYGREDGNRMAWTAGANQTVSRMN